MSVSKEHLLLIACCKRALADGPSQDIHTIIKQGVDWSLVLQLSMEHRISPTLYKALNDLNILPHSCQLELEKRFKITAAENKLKHDTLKEIMVEAQKRGLKPVGIKGAALVYSSYSEFNVLRESRDLDLLLSPKDFDPFCEMLYDLGFIQGSFCAEDDKIIAVDKEKKNNYENQNPNHTWPFYRKTDLPHYAIAVEPHRSITYKHNIYQVSSQKIIDKSISLRVDQVFLNIPCLIHELLVLCLVAFSDYSSLENMKMKSDIRLRTYCDILVLSKRVSKENLWDAFYECFVQSNNVFPVYQMLSFCAELFDVSLVPANYFLDYPYLRELKYSIHNIANFSSCKPIGYWNKDFKAIFSDTNRYYHALDILFCNCINTHFSCVRNLKQPGNFIELREKDDKS